MSVKVYERWHLYDGNALVNVYAELALLEQDAAHMTPNVIFVAKKVTETHQVHAVYGAAGLTPPAKKGKVHPVKQTPISYNLVEYDPEGGEKNGEAQAQTQQENWTV